jgi:adenylate cyclase class 2
VGAEFTLQPILQNKCYQNCQHLFKTKKQIMIEVELKFPVDSIDEVRQRLVNLGATPNSILDQSDEYLNDPVRDFAKLDMALRIRSSDETYVLTFKGPNLDPIAKIRQEIELPLADESVAEQMKGIFQGIVFYSVAKVVKRREDLSLIWQNENVHVCLDEVAEVGSFVELELVVEDDSKMLDAKQVLLGLAEAVGLTGAIRMSYLGMLLKNREQS